MGRYTYNSSVVSNAISELNDAIKSLANVTAEIQAGINTITNANGARAIDVDCSKLLKLQEMAEEVIEEDIKTIQSKAQVIEEYENAPWYKKLFSSIGMGLSKFVEGIASGIENITDGAVSIVGFVGGIFNSDFKNSVAEYVAKDHVGDWFQDQYDEGFLSGVSKYSYFSEHSTAANIFKGFGTAAPYIALSMTGVGTTVEVIAAGLGGVGSGTEAGINQALMNDPNLKAGDVFNKAFGKGVWQGTKNAAMVWAMNKLTKTIQSSTNDKTKKILDEAIEGMDDTTPRLPAATDPNYVAPKTTSPYTTTENIWSKAGKFGETKVGGAINAADDFVVNAGHKAGQAIQKVPGVTTVSNAVSTKAGKLWNSVKSSKLIDNKLVNGITTAVTNTVKAHPGAAYATVGTVFALDQVDEDVINSKVREQEEVGTITVRPQPTLTQTPFPTTTGTTPTPTVTTPTPSGTTPTPTTPTPSASTPRPTGGGGGTYTPTPSVTATTPMPTTPTATATPTTTIATPTPTQYQPTPTYTSTSYNPTYTPTSGGGGYTEEGYTGEGTEGEFDIPEAEEMGGSFSEIVGGNQYTDIPTSAAPITTTTTTTGKKSIIPVIAGLGAATVAGLGTKAFLDKKEENTAEDEFEADEWEEEDSLNIDYEEAMSEDSDYLSPADEIAYQEGDEEVDSEPSYEAVNSSELASMQ